MLDGIALPRLRSTFPQQVGLDPLDGINKRLALFWPLNEPGGTTVADISPYRRLGVRTNAPTSRVGRKGRYTFFTRASSQYVYQLGNAGITTTTGWSVSLWAYTATSGDYGAFVKIGASGDGFALGVGATNSLESSGAVLNVLLENAAWVSTGFNITTGWHHYAMTMATGNAIKIYYDGAQIYSATTGAPMLIPGTSGLGGASSVQVGGYTSYDVKNRMFQGGVALARVHNRVLAPAEVQRLFRDPWAGTIEPAARLFFAVRAPSSSRTGDLSATLAAATLSATGTLAISGTASATLAATTVVAAGTIALTGATSATLAAATLASTGTISLSATLTATLGAATLSAASTVALTGALTATLDAATLSAAGTAANVITGDLTATLGAATLSAASTLALRGTTTTTLGNATLVAAGTLQLRATASVTLAHTTLSATGTNGNVVNAIVLVWNGVRI